MKDATPGLSVDSIAVDLTDREASTEIQKKLREWDWTVDLLVNNAGFARKYVYAQNPETDTSSASVDLLVRAVVDLSLRFLPEMVRRGKGGILNVGIRKEQLARSTGVRVACIVPGVTETNLDGKGHGERRGPIDYVGIDQPADVAKVAVDALEENAAKHIVGLNNSILEAGINSLPDSTVAGIVSSASGAPGQELSQFLMSMGL